MGDPDPEPHKVKISEANMESGDQEPDNPKPLKGILKTNHKSINPGDTFDEDDEVVGTRLGLVRIMMKTDMIFNFFYIQSSRSSRNTRSIYSIDKSENGAVKGRLPFHNKSNTQNTQNTKCKCIFLCEKFIKNEKKIGI